MLDVLCKAKRRGEWLYPSGVSEGLGISSAECISAPDYPAAFAALDVLLAKRWVESRDDTRW